MARVTPPPEAHYTLPHDHAAALGQAVANFGWLEEVIKRTIYSLDRKRLAEDLTDAELATWMDRMGTLADDSMGTLIEQLDAAMRRFPGIRDRNRLTDRLNEIKFLRNLLCHASWRPTEDKTRWHPSFVSTRGTVYREDFSAAELLEIAQRAKDVGVRVLEVMRATGIHGEWAGDDA
ncbi:hypothetical protein [Paracoccus sulfuroxidans]|uniref:Uncharacterized protein n=1 Tax=Paracoccus sulfuroxidans TaxID=384678 RepID=A0A562NLB3_9RHOB|nr:hypothetical protein [Paracoccus sulfuroxidans]TWI32860.1 hypothetical protein IQ24_02738 [Paracoccus sulfuroxidans]